MRKSSRLAAILHLSERKIRVEPKCELLIVNWSQILGHLTLKTFSFLFIMYIGVKEVEQCNSRMMPPVVLLKQQW